MNGCGEMRKLIHAVPVIKACSFYETEDTHSDVLQDINCEACIATMLQNAITTIDGVYEHYCNVKKRQFEVFSERIDINEHI